MEKEKEPVTQTEEKTEVAVTQTDDKTEEKAEEKTFTQDEVNAMIAKERKKIPSKEEMQKFNEWKESQKTEAEKQTELTKNNVDLINKNNLLEQKLAVSDAGVPKKYRDFVQFTVSQMEGNFEDNLKEYLKENPQYLQITENTTDAKDEKVTDGVEVNKNTVSSESGVRSILQAKHPDLKF